MHKYSCNLEIMNLFRSRFPVFCSFVFSFLDAETLVLHWFAAPTPLPLWNNHLFAYLINSCCPTRMDGFLRCTPKCFFLFILDSATIRVYFCYNLKVEICLAVWMPFYSLIEFCFSNLLLLQIFLTILCKQFYSLWGLQSFHYLVRF